jgi:hypothetical protein
VLFTAQQPKTEAILSYDERPTAPGKYGEEILATSAD